MYIFQIIARNEIGDSAPFQLSQKCETGQKAPDRNPTGKNKALINDNYLSSHQIAIMPISNKEFESKALSQIT